MTGGSCRSGRGGCGGQIGEIGEFDGDTRSVHPEHGVPRKC